MKVLFNNYCPIYRIKNNYQPNFSSNFDKLNYGDIFEKAKEKKELDVQGVDEICKDNPDIPEDVKAHLRETIASSVFFNLVGEYTNLIKQGTLSIEEIYSTVSESISTKAMASVRSALDNSTLRDDRELLKFAENWKKAKKAYSGYTNVGLSGIGLYESLETKEDIVNFVHTFSAFKIFNPESQDETDYNEFGKFARELGAKNEVQFFKIFKHIHKKYHNIEEPEDVINCFKAIKESYPPKKEALLHIQEQYPDLIPQSVGKYYAKNSEMIDFLYGDGSKDFGKNLFTVVYHEAHEEKLSQQASKALKELVDTSTPEGKLDFYNFLSSEHISVREINQLYQAQYFNDIDPIDLIASKETIIANLTDNGLSQEEAKQYYINFAQGLNIVYNDDSNIWEGDSIKAFIKATQTFGIENDKDLVDFVARFNKDTRAKSPKSTNRNKSNKLELINTIDLLSYMDDSILQKCRSNKTYSPKEELIKKRNLFKRIKPQILEEIDKKSANRLCNNPFRLFIDYFDIYKNSPNIETFVDDAISKKIEEARQDPDRKIDREHLLVCFENEKTLDYFLAKNNITLDDKDDTHTQRCLKILDALFQDKSLEEIHSLAFKIANNDFISNSKNHLAKLLRGKSTEEIQAIFEIILELKIDSIKDINSLLNKYQGKNQSTTNFLMQYKASGLDFQQYIKRIESIQKEFSDMNLPITINDDNISMLVPKNFSKEKPKKEELYAMIKRSLNPDDGYNFIGGLDNAFCQTPSKPLTINITKELTYGMTGKYKSGFPNIVHLLNMENSDFTNSTDENLRVLTTTIDRRFSDLMKSDVFSFDDKTPNICLHAKMRLIERFILSDKDANLYSQESQEKIKNILSTIYTTSPEKVYGADNFKDRFIASFNSEYGEIRVAFANNGRILTIMDTITSQDD